MSLLYTLTFVFSHQACHPQGRILSRLYVFGIRSVYINKSLTIHFPLVRQNDLSSATGWINGESFLEGLFYVRCPHSLCISTSITIHIVLREGGEGGRGGGREGGGGEIGRPRWEGWRGWRGGRGLMTSCDTHTPTHKIMSSPLCDCGCMYYSLFVMMTIDLITRSLREWCQLC